MIYVSDSKIEKSTTESDKIANVSLVVADRLFPYDPTPVDSQHLQP